MRIGIIDLGTNSVRFDIREFSTSHKKGPAPKARKLHSERIMIRLGHSFFEKGEMDPRAIDRAAHALSHFKEVGDSFLVKKYFAFATATLRESADGKQIAKYLEEQSGIPIRIISGAEEARLIAKGILNNEKLPKGSFGIFDIGGGSSEIILCHGREALEWHSFALGTARLQQIFLKSTPPRPEDIKKLRQHVQQEAKRYLAKKKWPKVNFFLGSSGTLKTLSKIHREIFGEKTIQIENLSLILKLMESASTTELLAIPGMESKRVDMILAGALLAEGVLNAFGAKKIDYTDFALRDGILEQEKELLTHNTKRLHEETFESIFQKLSKLGYTPQQLTHAQQLTRKLFVGTSSLHRLDEIDGFLLEAAVLLRRIGHVISPFQFSEHSHYFIKHSEFAGLDPSESNRIADLCQNLPDKKLTLRLKKDKAFEKSLALLRLIDAIDFRFESRVQIKQIMLKKRELHLRLSGASGTGIEASRIDQCKAYLERVLKTKLIVRFS